MGKIVKTNKVEAARALLSRAIALLLDQEDYLCALVLAGAAEDVFEGVLKAAGRPSARSELAELMLSVDEPLPGEEPFTRKDAWLMLRMSTTGRGTPISRAKTRILSRWKWTGRTPPLTSFTAPQRIRCG